MVHVAILSFKNILKKVRVMQFIFLSLTCADQIEANTIARSLLEKRLVACVKMMPITASFVWQGAIESSNEILLLMESEGSKFKQIEQEVRTLHSYKTFVLTATAISHVSAGVAEWLCESLRG
jgi:periplasmic divalent cation tolerance protein